MSPEHNNFEAEQSSTEERDESKWQYLVERHKQLIKAVRDAETALHEFEIRELDINGDRE